MEKTPHNRSHRNQIFVITGLLVLTACLQVAAETSEKNSSLANAASNVTSQEQLAANIFKVSEDGGAQVFEVPEIFGDQKFTLQKDPVTGQVDFNTKTVDISVINEQKDRENAEKVAVIQKDLESRIKITEPKESEPKPVKKEVILPDSKEVEEKNAKVKEDIESRIMLENENKRYRAEKEDYVDVFKHPIKRADVDYYDDEPSPPAKSTSNKPRPSEEPPEEDSFFSIFESLFGANEEDAQTKKKSKPEETPMFKESEDGELNDEIKTLGDMLKPIKTGGEHIEERKPYGGYQDPQEYRITNDFHRPQTYKNGFSPIDREQSGHHSFHQRPNYEKPYHPYRPYPTQGYEDYDLEEFMEKNDKKPSPVPERRSTTRAAITSTSTSTTTTTTTTTAKPIKFFENKPTQHEILEKSDEVKDFEREKSSDEKKNEVIEHKFEKRPETETAAYLKSQKQPATEYFNNKANVQYETKVNELKPQKIQDSANFYNLINLPVRYSTKDTAIPLISTSYANTKVQGLGAQKYDKTNGGKYPNHKYESSSSTTKKPNYWSARRTSTPRTHFGGSSSSSSSSTSRTAAAISSTTVKSTTKYTSSINLSDLEYDDMEIGSSADLGGYGHKAGVEIRKQILPKQTETSNIKETTTRKTYDTSPPKEIIQEEESINFQFGHDKIKNKEVERKPEKPIQRPEVEYDEYEYDGYPAQVSPIKPPKEDRTDRPNLNEKNRDSSVKPFEFESKNKLETTTQEYKTTKKPSTGKPIEHQEYEYYDYEADVPTTTPKYRVKYPSLSKDKIKNASEKVAVVVPTRVQDPYVTEKPVKTSTTTTTTTTTTSTTKPNQPEDFMNFHDEQNHFYRPNQIKKEPAPVFEDSEEAAEYIPKYSTIPPKLFNEKPGNQEQKTKPIVVTATKKDPENNVNIVLIPTKNTNNNQPDRTRPEEIVTGTSPKVTARPSEIHRPHYDYTTEFTVGAVQGPGGPGGPGGPEGEIPVQGHFVATSMSASPFGGSDEPFRPIARPPGMTASFQVIGDESELQPKPAEEPQYYQPDKRPPPPLLLEETEPIHEPHEFIPSPQFHRPGEPKPAPESQPGSPEISIDYDFDGIQTEPKPGQYVIFSKPQLNPEMNENQIKKKPEINVPNKLAVPHLHEGPVQYSENKKPVYQPKPVQFHLNNQEVKPPSQENPHFGALPDIDDNRPSFQLTPPKGTQTEKPFEGNFLVPEQEKSENTANYPRPHWEKNQKPGFLLNSLPNKNELPGNRQPPLPPQMAPTLIPPSNSIPQRFRKPIPSNMPPLRKTFNEGGINTKPKPNLPNILPQFRPNAKIGGPYQRPFHRPPGFVNQNRRNGPNRYHDKENGNFPYHIQHPVEKDTLMHRDFEVEPGMEEIVPKFITNRGKLPNEMMEQYALQKRYGAAPMNVRTRLERPRPNDMKILRRHQRTPVTTLQMLQQKPGIKTHKTPVTREDNADPMAPLVPPVYKTYKEESNNDRNLYLVYPANSPSKSRFPNEHKKRQPNIHIENPEKFTYNYSKTEDQYPLLNPTRRTYHYNERPKNEFPYGFVKPDEKLKLVRKNPEINEPPKLPADEKEIKPNLQDYMPYATKKPFPSDSKDDKIDMNLHMQSNNQWNKVTESEDEINIITQNPLEATKATATIITDDHTPFRITEYPSGVTQGYPEGNELRVNPPSEYHTSIKDENNSAFTLGAVMHTVPEGNKKGQVASVSLNDDAPGLLLPSLNVNERISNGKIVTVSMPLDVKEEPKEKPNIPLMAKEPSSVNEKYQFQAPFQASSSITNNEAEPTNQGWSIVKNPTEASEKEDKDQDVDQTTNTTRFNIEDFQPELQGGFKPLYELPEEELESKRPEDIRDREERKSSFR